MAIMMTFCDSMTLALMRFFVRVGLFPYTARTKKLTSIVLEGSITDG